MPHLDAIEYARISTVIHTWRMAWVLATLNHEQLLDADRENDLDELVTEALEVMQETMAEGAL